MQTLPILSKVPAENVEAGDICAVCGINDIMLCEALPTIKVEEPTVKMSFSINISSFVGREVVQATMNKDVGYDFAVDIWSLGFTIIELFTGKHPWSGLEVDVSEVSKVPDYQEAFVDSSCDESLIFEMLDFKKVIEDDTSAVWFLQGIAREQDEEESMVSNAPVIYTIAVGQMTISKDSQEMEAPKSVQVSLFRKLLKEVGTDVLITAYVQNLKKITIILRFGHIFFLCFSRHLHDKN
ncbi:hypothetical protein KFK09_000494 [Dendrobium nobile]|uniref:Protein kinase domain-containing protein n=1 Tax=Dendrobium nobile TaxID=94219 RepID=A0A8T3CB89_DENNO|nr:hypothetical protein KFK09_000494 [Dendrobium nobile]